MPHSPCSGPREGRRRADGERGRHRRKERVLHTRVSESLAEDIRRIAEDLRVPASNLVRNVLEEVFDVAVAVSDDVGELFDEVLDEAEAARSRLAGSRSRRRQRRQQRDRAAWEAARAELDATERSASPPPPPVPWHVVEGGRAAGPLRFADLERAVRRGRLTAESLVWCAGMDDWRPAGELAALEALFRPPPVPEAPAASAAGSSRAPREGSE